MPFILLCWITMSGAEVGDMSVEVEPYHEYVFLF